MKRLGMGLLIGLVAAASSVASTSAAVAVTVSVSPAAGVVGRPVEVLLRTFAPTVAGADGLPIPSLAYPVSSGLWNILYPIADYPFDVTATAVDGSTIVIQLMRDPTDASLWRGTFTPISSGDWTVQVRNFPAGTPGTSARLSVGQNDVVPTWALPGVATFLIGIAFGVILGRRGRAPLKRASSIGSPL
jgi:hypothetical protein